MTKNAFLYIVVLFTSLSAGAQNFYSAGEAGVAIGGAQYFGDLNEKKFNYIRPAGGAFFRYHFNPYISGKVSLNYAHVGYDDKMSSNDPYALKRNLNFQTDIIEASVQAEFNFFRFATGADGNRFTPYLTGGFGVFYYNPYTTFKDERYYLRPLGTEGQNVGYDDHKYSRTSFCFPIGVGMKYWLRPGINIGFEIADRLTLTDYMDDVSTYYVGSEFFAGGLSEPPPAYYIQDRSIEVDPSTPLGRAGKQRGNPSTRDQYMTAVFTISFQLKVYKCPGYMNRDFPQVD